MWICLYLFSLSDSCVDLSVFVFFVRQLCGFVCICFLCQVVVWICLYLYSLSDSCGFFSYFFSLAIRILDLSLFVLSFAAPPLLSHAAPCEFPQRSLECYFVCNAGKFGREKQECHGKKK